MGQGSPRGRLKKKTNGEKRENKLNKKRIRKSSGKVERVMVEIGTCINISTFLSPWHSHSLGPIIRNTKPFRPSFQHK